MEFNYYIFQFFGKDNEYDILLKQYKGKECRTITMKNNENEKEIIPIKIELDTDTEIRACNFYGTTKTGKKYITPQLVFVRAVGCNKSIDISFNIKQLGQILESLARIRSENEDYFECL